MNKRYLAVFMVVCLAIGEPFFQPGEASGQEAVKTQAPAWFKQADKDADRKLSCDEAPNKEVFTDVDADQDGFASLEEVTKWLATLCGIDRAETAVFGRQYWMARRITTKSLPASRAYPPTFRFWHSYLTCTCAVKQPGTI